MRNLWESDENKMGQKKYRDEKMKFDLPLLLFESLDKN